MHKARELKPATILKLFNGIDLWRKPQRLEDILCCCQADLRGRTGFEQADYPQARYLQQLAHAANAVNVRDIVATGIQGAAIGAALQQARLDAISTAKRAWQDS